LLQKLVNKSHKNEEYDSDQMTCWDSEKIIISKLKSSPELADPEPCLLASVEKHFN
jgi:hypothetical protein